MPVLARDPHLSMRSAAFIGVGAVVGPGIFALQGYPFAGFGARLTPGPVRNERRR
jgi:hypothetical protein